MNPPRERHIEEQWLKYREMVIPADAPPIQIAETRLAFFAGCASLFFLITARLDPGTDATEHDLLFMDAIAAEIEEHAARRLAEIEGGH